MGTPILEKEESDRVAFLNELVDSDEQLELLKNEGLKFAVLKSLEESVNRFKQKYIDLPGGTMPLLYGLKQAFINDPVVVIDVYKLFSDTEEAKQHWEDRSDLEINCFEISEKIIAAYKQYVGQQGSDITP